MESSSSTGERDTFEQVRQAIENRRALLGPCLAAMGFTEQGGPPPELPEQLQFDGQLLVLELWERNELLGLGQSSGNSEILLSHLAEGLAFRARSQSTLQKLELDPPQDNDLRRLGEVIEEAAVGLALQQEVQRGIDRLVSKGEIADAKKLTGFRRKIDQGLSGLKQVLGDRAHEQVRARAAEMLTPRIVEPAPRKRAVARVAPDLPVSTPIVPERAAAPEIEEPESEKPEPTPEELFELGLSQQAASEAGIPYRAQVGPASEPVSGLRFRRLLYGLVACIVTYAIFLAVRPGEVPLPDRLGIERFQHLDGVLEVRPRPPSLFVELEAGSWAGKSNEAKLELLESLGRIAGDEGYFGVQVKTDTGRSVGRWLEKTGADLIAQEPGS